MIPVIIPPLGAQVELKFAGCIPPSATSPSGQYRVDIALDQGLRLVQAPYDAACDFYLFDTAGLKESFGGTGQQFDWNILKKAKIEKPFFLSGGIGPDDAQKVKSFKHPDFFAVDVNSKFELSPGLKDMAAILKFLQGFK